MKPCGHSDRVHRRAGRFMHDVRFRFRWIVEPTAPAPGTGPDLMKRWVSRLVRQWVSFGDPIDLEATSEHDPR